MMGSLILWKELCGYKMAHVVYKAKGSAAEYSLWASNIYAGCASSCVYCYSPRVLHQKKEDYHNCKGVRKGYFERLDRECERRLHEGKNVLLCFTSDPYQNLEHELLATRRTIETLHNGGASVTILTKCPTLALRDMDILIPGYDVVATTLTFASGEGMLSNEWEPGGDLPALRISAMRKFKERGFETWVSMEPTIIPESTLTLIKETVGIFDLYRIGRLSYMDTSHIDWPKFAQDATELLEGLGLNYKLKASLQFDKKG